MLAVFICRVAYDVAAMAICNFKQISKTFPEPFRPKKFDPQIPLPSHGWTNGAHRDQQNEEHATLCRDQL